MLHGFEDLPSLDIDEAELTIADRAVTVDGCSRSGLMSCAFDVGEPDRWHTEFPRWSR
ncbi:hypothetical protein [Brevibacterium sp. 'Marine']|uniref:hypothetical protein n=1 Tax=Brevibacterium sp. 'Marine' TaxID=2725563 RepID=UPI002006EEC6|nr:hypothetical protein [Brevibacterium sp. 'Marine']